MYTALKNARVKLELIIIAAPSTVTITSHTRTKKPHNAFYSAGIMFAEWKAVLPLLCTQSTLQYVTHLFNMPKGAVAQKQYLFSPCLATILWPPTDHNSPLLQQIKMYTSLVSKTAASGEVPQATLMTVIKIISYCSLLISTDPHRKKCLYNMYFSDILYILQSVFFRKSLVKVSKHET